VIQIFTKAGAGRPHFNLSAAAGTYNTRRLSVGYGGQVGGTRFDLQLGHSSTDGFSAIGNPANFYYNPDRDGFRDNSLSARVSHAVGADHEVGLTLFNSTGKAHYDGYPSTFDSRTEHTVSAYGVYSKNRFLPGWQSLLRAGVGTDDYTSITTTRSKFRTVQNQATWKNDINAGGGLLTLGLEWLQQKVSGATDYALTRRDVHSYLAGYQRRFGKHSVQLHVRSDDNSQYGRRNTGSLAYGYQFTSAWRATASVGTAFKAPTFNDLYYPLTYGSVGNPNLRPERSRNREVALRYDNGGQQFGVVHYDNQVTDLISWQLYGPGYTPMNVGQASLKGTTFSYHGRAAGYGVRAVLDLQDPVDDSTGHLLPRRARRHGMVGLNRSVGPWELGGEVVFSGARYDDTANKNRLGGYGLVDLTARYRISRDVSLNARVNNLFDKKYALAKDYNTPGTDLFVALRYEPR
jgi:vitamin B12 transporter